MLSGTEWLRGLAVEGIVLGRALRGGDKRGWEERGGGGRTEGGRRKGRGGEKRVRGGGSWIKIRPRLKEKTNGWIKIHKKIGG